ncbi:MAG: inositol-3-phosphate synthase [Thermoguttaceae bacterium]
MSPKAARVGVDWIGIQGGVATTALIGHILLKKGLAATGGLVTELPRFQNLGLPNWGDLVFAGHEIRRDSLWDSVQWLTDERLVRREQLDACHDELDAIDRRVRSGTIRNVGPTIQRLADRELPTAEAPRQTVARLQADLAEFVRRESLDHVIVMNVASTEPPIDTADWPTDWDAMDRWLDDPQCPLPASSLYAIAALEAGHSYLNFTPSLGSAPAAVDDLALRRHTRHYGCDGKTGETLMKSVLAPMFAHRNLPVRSWVGHNIFGNRDGLVLDDPANKRSKVSSKDHLIGEILGYRPKTLVSIEYLPDLGDRKTAWDHIHFTGFLGVPMTLQFTWQGCDSALAAPLVLDLVRLTELARRRGHTGLMTFLASFFKSPYGVDQHAFERQFQMLEQWVQDVS